MNGETWCLTFLIYCTFLWKFIGVTQFSQMAKHFLDYEILDVKMNKQDGAMTMTKSQVIHTVQQSSEHNTLLPNLIRNCFTKQKNLLIASYIRPAALWVDWGSNGSLLLGHVTPSMALCFRSWWTWKEREFNKFKFSVCCFKQQTAFHICHCVWSILSGTFTVVC